MYSEKTVNRVELQFPLKAFLAPLTSPGVFFLRFVVWCFFLWLVGFFCPFIFFPSLEHAEGQRAKGSAT